MSWIISSTFTVLFVATTIVMFVLYYGYDLLRNENSWVYLVLQFAEFFVVLVIFVPISILLICKVSRFTDLIFIRFELMSTALIGIFLC